MTSSWRYIVICECNSRGERGWFRMLPGSSYHCTVYPKKYAHGFVVLCFVVVMQSFIMNSHEVFIHIHQGCFAGTGAIVRLPQCQWSKPVGYGKINQCITTTKHSKAKTVCIFLGIYCISHIFYSISPGLITVSPASITHIKHCKKTCHVRVKQSKLQSNVRVATICHFYIWRHYDVI